MRHREGRVGVAQNIRPKRGLWLELAEDDMGKLPKDPHALRVRNRQGMRRKRRKDRRRGRRKNGRRKRRKRRKKKGRWSKGRWGDKVTDLDTRRRSGLSRLRSRRTEGPFRALSRAKSSYCC